MTCCFQSTRHCCTANASQKQVCSTPIATREASHSASRSHQHVQVYATTIHALSTCSGTRHLQENWGSAVDRAQHGLMAESELQAIEVRSLVLWISYEACVVDEFAQIPGMLFSVCEIHPDRFMEVKRYLVDFAWA